MYYGHDLGEKAKPLAEMGVYLFFSPADLPELVSIVDFARAYGEIPGFTHATLPNFFILPHPGKKKREKWVQIPLHELIEDCVGWWENGEMGVMRIAIGLRETCGPFLHAYRDIITDEGGLSKYMHWDDEVRVRAFYKEFVRNHFPTHAQMH